MTTPADEIVNVGEFLLQIADIKRARFPDDDLAPWYRGQSTGGMGIAAKSISNRRNLR